MTTTQAQAIRQLQVLSPAAYILIDDSTGLQVGEGYTSHLNANAACLELARRTHGSYSIVPLARQPDRR